MKKNFLAIAISVLLIYLFHVLDLIFPGIQDSSDFLFFALSVSMMLVILFVGMIQIIFFQFYRKINLSVFRFVAAYSLVFAVVAFTEPLLFPRYDRKGLFLFIIPAAFYWFAVKKKLFFFSTINRQDKRIGVK